MARAHIHSVLELDGTTTVSEVPFTEADYLAEIAAAEAEITPRRLREAVLTETGRTWLAEAELRLKALRKELADWRAARSV